MWGGKWGWEGHGSLARDALTHPSDLGPFPPLPHPFLSFFSAFPPHSHLPHTCALLGTQGQVHGLEQMAEEDDVDFGFTTCENLLWGDTFTSNLSVFD